MTTPSVQPVGCGWPDTAAAAPQPAPSAAPPAASEDEVATTPLGTTGGLGWSEATLLPFRAGEGSSLHADRR